MQSANHWLKSLIILAIIAATFGKTYKKRFINPYPRYKAFNDGGDPGEPLFLTPLIKNASIPRADIQKLASVTPWHDVKSYSGYLTVKENFNSNMFFWYFPAEDDSNYAPVVLWLQGGPGASSLFGLFVENGPFELDHNGNVQKRNYTWSRKNNLIFIDNPVGTGFSFTDHEAGYARNEKDVGRDLHEAVMQLYELFEWSEKSGFWITGESYGGKYVPALAYHIHKVQNSIDVRTHIPMKGLAIGNGFTDPVHQSNYADYLYQLGLIDDNAYDNFTALQEKGVECIRSRNWECANKVFDQLIEGSPDEPSLFTNLTGFEFYFNYLRTKDDDSMKVMGNFLQSSQTRRAIHVGNKTFHDLDGENIVEEHLNNDILDTVAPWVAELLDYYTVCIYNGQLDIVVAYPLTRNYLNHLKWSAADRYKIAPREIWRVDGEVAGYAKHAGHLVEIMVRNAGHMVPSDQPKWMFELINHLTHYKRN